jgi:hypothetical protein
MVPMPWPESSAEHGNLLRLRGADASFRSLDASLDGIATMAYFSLPEPLRVEPSHPDHLGPDVRESMSLPKALRRQAALLLRWLASASKRSRRLLLPTVRRILAPAWHPHALSRRPLPQIHTQPPGRLVATSPAAPHAPPTVAIAPLRGWMAAVAVG